MKVKYANEKIECQCTSLKAASKLFGGNKVFAISLLSRIHALMAAEVIKILLSTLNSIFIIYMVTERVCFPLM